MADNVYIGSQRGNKFKADVVGGVAILGVKLVIGADNTDGGYIDAVGSKMFVVDAGYFNQIREGNVSGHDFISLRGHCHSVDTADQELSALGTAGFGNWPSAAAGAVLVSTDVADDGDPVGTGARTVIVRGLDSSWVEKTETVTMNGTTPTAATTQTFLRINELEVITAGTSLTNEGDITASISGTDIIKIYAIHTTSDAGRYSVPAGRALYLQNPEGSSVGNQENTYHIFARDAGVANSPFKLKASWHSKDGGYRPNGILPGFPEKTDVMFITHAEIIGAIVSASAIGWVEDV